MQLSSDFEDLFRKLPVSLETAGQIFVKNAQFCNNVYRVRMIRNLFGHLS